MTRLPTVPAGPDRSPSGRDQLWALAVLGTVFILTLVLTGDVGAAVTAVSTLVAARVALAQVPV